MNPLIKSALILFASVAISGCTSTYFKVGDKWEMRRTTLLQKQTIPNVIIHANGDVELTGYENDGGNAELKAAAAELGKAILKEVAP